MSALDQLRKKINKKKAKLKSVATLTLGSQPRQRLAKMRAKCEGWE
jgi:hypothetical protein